MKIFIQYKNNKILYETYKYQSIYSIIDNFINLNNNIINKDPNNYFLDYNGSILNKDSCLEKYTDNNYIFLNLFEKKRGGSNFISFAAKNPLLVFIVFIIALLPIFLLPTGMTGLISELIKNICEKSLNAIGIYLSCVLGKKTLYKRIKLILIFIQYIIYTSMTYILISFPIILLCITIKGHSLGDNPQSMCGAIKTGNLVGMLLIICYMGLFVLFRFGNYIFEVLIYIFKMSYYLNMLFVPTFKSILSLFNRFKYIPIYTIPFLGQGMLAFHTSSELTLIAAEMILGSLTTMGCSAIDTNIMKDGVKGVGKVMKDGQKIIGSVIKDGKKTLSKATNDGNKFIDSVMTKIKDFKGKMADPCECECARRHREEEALYKDHKKDLDDLKKSNKKDLDDSEKNNNKKDLDDSEENNNENDLSDFKEIDNICYEDKIKCCAPERYVGIADTLNLIIKNPFMSKGIKIIGLFPAFVLFTTALYEAALLRMGDDDDIITKTIEQKKYYLRKILKDKIDLLEDDTKKTIQEYLNDQEINQNSNILIYEIKKKINRNSPPENEGIKILKERIAKIEDSMIEYARESGTVYTPGKSLFKNIFKILFMDIFCNVASTAKNGKDIIEAMGSMTNIVDLLKAGSSSGLITAFIYLFTLIGVIICGIFNVF